MIKSIGCKTELEVNALAVNIGYCRYVREPGIQAKLGEAAFLLFPGFRQSPSKLSPLSTAHLPFLHLILVNGRLWWTLVE